MRKLFRMLAVFLCAAAGLQACTPPPESTPAADGTTVPAQLRTAHSGYLAAWNGEDPAAVGSFLTDDVHGVIGADTHHGRAQLVSAWVQPNLPTLSNLTAMPESFTVSGNQITERGRYRFQASPPGGSPMMVGGTYTHVWTRQPDGSWRISAMTVSDAAP